MRHLQLLSRYNALFNRQLHAVLAAQGGGLDDAVVVQLNHIYVMDRIWLDRLTVADDCARFDAAMDAICFPQLEPWWTARRQLDREIELFVASATALEDEVEFVTRADNIRVRCRMDDALAHLFNHQSLHRGEILHILNRNMVPFGNADLLPLIVRAD